MNGKISKYFIAFFLLIFLTDCSKDLFKKVDNRNRPVNMQERARQNVEQGKGIRMLYGGSKGTNFEFASSNPLWRASLDSIDFMPLASVNYSGGVIITDWYNNNQNSNESIKISIRFLTNEIRSDALDIKVFNRICKNYSNCKISEGNKEIIMELKKKILKTAKLYETQKENNKEFKPYKVQKQK